MDVVPPSRRHSSVNARCCSRWNLGPRLVQVTVADAVISGRQTLAVAGKSLPSGLGSLIFGGWTRHDRRPAASPEFKNLCQATRLQKLRWLSTNLYHPACYSSVPCRLSRLPHRPVRGWELMTWGWHVQSWPQTPKSLGQLSTALTRICLALCVVLLRMRLRVAGLPTTS